MGKPRLTFFCELKAEELRAVFSSPSLFEDLTALGAGISLGILDLSQARVNVVRQLNERGIPVVAWLLLPEDQGYWFNLDNASQAKAFYQEFIRWTRENDLLWAGVGFDIEPDIRELQQVTDQWWQLLPKLFRRVFDHGRLRRGQRVYKDLIRQVQLDGYLVESYQLPLIIDERIIGSSLIQKVAGLVDLRVDREVMMIYTSAIRPYGPGVLWNYGREYSRLDPGHKTRRSTRRARFAGVPAIGVGSTGGGVEIDLVEARPLEWVEFARDLRFAWNWCDDIYIFSLEGCVQQGYLSRLKKFNWEGPLLYPSQQSVLVGRWRRFLRSILWVSAHPFVVLFGLLGGIWLLARLRRLANNGE
jgi:hypothetical protein